MLSDLDVAPGQTWLEVLVGWWNGGRRDVVASYLARRSARALRFADELDGAERRDLAGRVRQVEGQIERPLDREALARVLRPDEGQA